MNKEREFEKIFRENYNKVQYFAYGYLKDSVAAENVAQEVFTRLWKSWNTVKHDEDVLPYLITIAKNYSLNLIRKQRYERKYSESETLRFSQIVSYEALCELNATSLYSKDITRIVNDGLNELSADERETFYLSRKGGKTNKEIAQQQNISIKTVEARITKVLKYLRVCLKDYLPLIIGFLFNKVLL